MAKGDDVRRWRIEDKSRWLIFTRRGTKIDDYPAIKAHLEKWRENLEPKPRDWKGEDWNGRKPGSYKWFEIQDEVAYFAEFDKPKIVYPVVGKEPRFTLDRNQTFTNDKGFIIASSELFLLGVLNSSSVWDFLKATCSALGDADTSGRLELRSIYMTELPIPDAPASERAAIGALVQHCLDARGIGCAAWEADINARVAALYGL